MVLDAEGAGQTKVPSHNLVAAPSRASPDAAREKAPRLRPGKSLLTCGRPTLLTLPSSGRTLGTEHLGPSSTRGNGQLRGLTDLRAYQIAAGDAGAWAFSAAVAPSLFLAALM